ncbi:DUF3219 family protein [Peribacillus sp. SCS-155]|uniref:DUF3219 family protein n=1 Tax=Peribacillus sedimenti TaxID=3115297 RepID=UPI003906AA0E
MAESIILDARMIKITNYEEMKIDSSGKLRISFDFRVTSEEYHDITTLLYRMNFLVRVPDRKLEFNGTIHQYYTSVTDLYKENQVGDFHLVIDEK